jgi:alanyl-tRNA synthetase
MAISARELRLKYLRFFETKAHTVFPSGSLIPFDVTGKLDESLLFNGAGMVQFKPFFRGAASPPNKRLTTAQKCVRTGDIESVGDLSHLTFFEMLGNFSFGDYFKAEAIDFSWEFLTSKEWLGLDPNRLSFTVFEEDDVAFEAWSKHLSAAGIDPYSRIFRLDEETNYWPAGAFSKGPPGPCGPNSEMFYWVSDAPPPTTGYTREDWIADDDAKNWLEIWNDVFIQFEWKGRLRNPDRPGDGYEKDGMDNLPFQSIDTGMGLERTVAVLNGFKSVYQTDAFTPILARIHALHGGFDVAGVGIDDNPTANAVRVIADHIRTACFCIADGVLPANNGRGYVLRRLIRRAVLKGLRTLGFDQPFMHVVYEGVVESMGDHYSELVERRDVIVETLLNEENLFRRTLHQGSAMLQEQLEGLSRAGDATTKVLGGAIAFRLYDTFGFPLEVTRELCEEAGVAVDEEGFEHAMHQAQELSRGASGMDTVYADSDETLIIVGSNLARANTEFLGYDSTEAPTEIVQISPRLDAHGKTTGAFQVCLDATPFYAESGGQVGDTGTITALGKRHFKFEVTHTWKHIGMFWCDANLVECEVEMVDLSAEEITELLESGFFFGPVHARVDAERRRRITRNHSATHLLHAALRQVLGKHVTQAGSLVNEEHLRFDFTHGRAMTPDERAEVEAIVNARALEGTPVQIHADIPIAEAKARGAMALFGEKYGDRVRMVEMGEFSRELCGGIHVQQTSEIGLFVIAHEASAASGVRRIEALTGEAAYAFVREQRANVEHAAHLLKSNAGELVSAVERMLETAREERKKAETLQRQLLSGGSAATADTFETVGAIKLWRQRFDGVDSKFVAEKIDNLVASNTDLVAVAAIVSDGKIQFVAKCGAAAVSAGAHAGNLVREVAKIAGGGGGGRPDFATAGGKDVAKVDDALAAVNGLLPA